MNSGQWNVNLYLSALERIDPVLWVGKVTQIVGLLVESEGPSAAIGDFCEIRTGGGRAIRTQVVGFREGRVLSIPLEETDGPEAGNTVVARTAEATIAA